MGSLRIKALSGDDTSISISVVEKFIGGLRGPGLLPQDDDYEESRKIWNGMIDRKPALIVRCQGVSDVIDCVNFARENEILTSVKGGGHNIAGNAVCEGGLMIDLSMMKSVRVDPDNFLAHAEPGVSLGELDHETQAFGLAAPAGIVTTTGIAGLTLGGGFGWTSRKFGLTCDNLLSVQIVTAEGKLIKASENENPDLFWGVRGGGGNFGIVTSFEYKLFPHGPIVTAGLRFHSFEKARDVLSFYSDYSKEVPDEVTMIAVVRTAPAAPFLPESVHGKPVAVIGYCYSGSIEEGEKYARPIKELDSVVADLIQPMKFTDLQSMLDAGQPKGWNYYWKAENIAELTDDAIDTIISHTSNFTSPTTLVALFQMRGAVSRIGENDTAYSHRDAAIALNINASWTDPSEAEKHIKWTRDFWRSMQPFSTGGAYINFQSQDEGEERVQATYGQEKLEKLVKLKNKYDPRNLFRLNQNIKPTV